MVIVSTLYAIAGAIIVGVASTGPDNCVSIGAPIFGTILTAIGIILAGWASLEFGPKAEKGLLIRSEPLTDPAILRLQEDQRMIVGELINLTSRTLAPIGPQPAVAPFA